MTSAIETILSDPNTLTTEELLEAQDLIQEELMQRASAPVQIQPFPGLECLILELFKSSLTWADWYYPGIYNKYAHLLNCEENLELCENIEATLAKISEANATVHEIYDEKNCGDVINNNAQTQQVVEGATSTETQTCGCPGETVQQPGLR